MSSQSYWVIKLVFCNSVTVADCVRVSCCFLSSPHDLCSKLNCTHHHYHNHDNRHRQYLHHYSRRLHHHHHAVITFSAFNVSLVPAFVRTLHKGRAKKMAYESNIYKLLRLSWLVSYFNCIVREQVYKLFLSSKLSMLSASFHHMCL